MKKCQVAPQKISRIGINMLFAAIPSICLVSEEFSERLVSGSTTLVEASTSSESVSNWVWGFFHGAILYFTEELEGQNLLLLEKFLALLPFGKIEEGTRHHPPYLEGTSTQAGPLASMSDGAFPSIWLPPKADTVKSRSEALAYEDSCFNGVAR
ncbi:hypothetical protein ACJX0J_037369 [Zea mays]